MTRGWLGGRWASVGLLAMLPAATLPEVTQVDLGRASLRGLPGVFVVAEETSREARAQGVTPEWLEKRIRDDLRRRGIGALERSDALSSTRRPMLVVRVQTVRLPDQGIVAWHLALAVHQDVRTPGDPPVVFAAKTWEASSTLGVTTASLLRVSIGRTLADQMDEFGRAWAERDSSR